MKLFVVTLVIVCVAATAGTVIYLNRQKTLPVSAPVAEAFLQQMEQKPPEKIAAPKTEAPPAVSENTAKPVQVPVAAPIATGTKPDDSVNLIHKAVDALLSAKSAGEKHDLFQQLIKSGQLDAAMAELKQRAADNPNNAQLPTTLGEAQINKLRAIKEAGGDPNDMGILAMQADQNFTEALKIDPSNWEAQFVRASALSGWPVELNKGPEVIQQLSSLIDQQETMTSQPQFAQTYVLLGDQYQKAGQLDYAQATWQLGLTKFPSDSTLQKRISTPSGQ